MEQSVKSWKKFLIKEQQLVQKTTDVANLTKKLYSNKVDIDTNKLQQSIDKIDIEGADLLNLDPLGIINMIFSVAFGTGSPAKFLEKIGITKKKGSSEPTKNNQDKTQADISSTIGPSQIAKNNIKYFGNPQGRAGNGWKTSLDSTRRYNRVLNFLLGPIPYKGSTDGRGAARLNPQWIKDNIRRYNSPVGSFRLNRHIADSLLAAINESRSKYGVPIRNVGGFVVGGIDTGFSSHAWGAAIDFDSLVNTYSVGGLLPLSYTRSARKGKSGTNVYWNLKNPQGQTWKEYLDSLKFYQKADPLYVFLAGPKNNNGIAKIFRKYGWSWGGQYRGKKQDSMHFEYLVRRR